MKLPSLASLSKHAVAVYKRFPTLFVTVVFATALCCYLIEEPEIDNLVEHRLWRLLVTTNLLLTLGLSADLFAESRAYTAIRKWILRAAAIALCALLYAVLNPFAYQTDVVRFGLFVFAFHQLVAFAPFIGRGGSGDFWHFNKSLFLRFLTAALYAATLFVGLAIAVYGVEELFNLDLPSKVYSQLFAVIAVGFNPLFFLAGVPAVHNAETADIEYPKGLKIFTQYVLIPLMTIYLGILLVYEIKILIDWELPNGIVATLILCYAVFGVLSLLLVWPVKKEVGNRWVQLFSRSFYLTLIPLIVLLALAIGKRVSNYGFTEERYILVIIGIWLAGICVYFLFFRKDDIKLIPISLFTVALLSTFGPQSATNISRNAQQARLVKALDPASKQGEGESASIVSYLVDAHGLRSLQGFTDTDLGALDSEITEKHADLSLYSINNLKRDTIFALLNVSAVGVESGRYLYIYSDHLGVIPVGGYDYSYRVEAYHTINTEIRVGDQTCKLTLDNEAKQLTIAMERDSTLVFDLALLEEELYRAYKDGRLTKKADGEDQFSYAADRMCLQEENDHFAVALMMERLDGTLRPAGDTSDYGLNFSGYLLFREK